MMMEGERGGGRGVHRACPVGGGNVEKGPHSNDCKAIGSGTGENICDHELIRIAGIVIVRTQPTKRQSIHCEHIRISSDKLINHRDI